MVTKPNKGPTAVTPGHLDYLAAKNIRATFCVIGSRVKDYPDILLRAYQEGHQICVHSWSHRALSSQPTSVIVAELEWTLMIIEQVTGQRPVFFRPPFGDHGTVS
jgi:peptidoglycan/xylan/chitin deacetylase (PgdA/CDA1 family)